LGFNSGRKTVFFIKLTAVYDGVHKAAQMTVARSMVAYIFFPRKAVFVREYETIQVTITSRNKTDVVVQDTILFIDILKALDMAARRSTVGDIRAERATVLGRIPQTFEMSFLGGIRSGL
jgi:hypothetical protein